MTTSNVTAPTATDREAVSDATKLLLEAADSELLTARGMLAVLRRTLDVDDQEQAEQLALIERVERMLEAVGSSIEYAAMGAPRLGPLWPGPNAENRAQLRAEALAALEAEEVRQ